MKIFAAFLLQIRELFEGNFTWRGFVLLALFVLMALIAVGFFVFVSYKAFQSGSKKK